MKPDPVEAAVLAAMQRRAAALQGPAQQWLLQRIEARRAAPPPAGPRPSPRHPAGALAELSNLVDRLGRMAPAQKAAAPQPLKAVAAFKGTWSRLRAEQRLRQALSQVPAMAGPLNSSHVVNRALQTLHGLSPEYLDAFMSHVDTLLWLEQASGGDLAPRAPARGRGPARA